MVAERPKVIYNDLTQQFVMWMHIDDARCACLLFWIAWLLSTHCYH